MRQEFFLLVRALYTERLCLPAQRTSKPELNCKHEICMPCQLCAAQRMDGAFCCAVNISRCLPVRQPTNAEEPRRSPLLQQSVLRTCCNPTEATQETLRLTLCARRTFSCLRGFTPRVSTSLPWSAVGAKPQPHCHDYIFAALELNLSMLLVRNAVGTQHSSAQRFV